jgi:hypothetical protein
MSITEFTKVLNLFKSNFDKEFVETFLIQKVRWNENFLLCSHVYLYPDYCSDLLNLFELIYSICGPDFELFTDLFNKTFLMKLNRN